MKICHGAKALNGTEHLKKLKMPLIDEMWNFVVFKRLCLKNFKYFIAEVPWKSFEKLLPLELS